MANPGAWTLPQGSWQVINNVSYYHSDERFTATGGKIPQPTYQKLEYNPYIEYGLWDHTTIGANLFLQAARSQGEQNVGLADAELFVRSRVWSAKPAWKQSELVLSIQPMVKLPTLFETEDNPIIGSDEGDIGISVFNGYSFNYFGQKTFTENEIHYRHRLGEREDQFRFNTTIGQDITPKWQVLAQQFTILSTNTVQGSTFTQSSEDDFDLVKVQLSGVYHVDERISMQLGGFYNLTGNNIGNGFGGLFAVWTRF